jgi:hypothetical protein
MEYGTLSGSTVGEQGQHNFEMTFPLRECRACPTVGYAVLALGFDANGALVSQQLQPFRPPLGTWGVVTGTGSCLNVRQQPSSSSEVEHCLSDGTAVYIDDIAETGTDIWVHFRDPGGWAMGEYIRLGGAPYPTLAPPEMSRDIAAAIGRFVEGYGLVYLGDCGTVRAVPPDLNRYRCSTVQRRTDSLAVNVILTVPTTGPAHNLTLEFRDGQWVPTALGAGRNKPLVNPPAFP